MILKVSQKKQLINVALDINEYSQITIFIDSTMKHKIFFIDYIILMKNNNIKS